jgi:hypothetical protein
MALDKYYLNLVGEYRTAAELLKHAIFATITYGNKKGADIYAIGPNRRTAVIEVKASNSNRIVTKFYQKYKDETQEHPDFWVLYRLAQDGSEEFFVLTHQEMAVTQAAWSGSSAFRAGAGSAGRPRPRRSPAQSSPRPGRRSPNCWRAVLRRVSRSRSS